MERQEDHFVHVEGGALSDSSAWFTRYNLTMMSVWGSLAGIFGYCAFYILWIANKNLVTISKNDRESTQSTAKMIVLTNSFQQQRNILFDRITTLKQELIANDAQKDPDVLQVEVMSVPYKFNELIAEGIKAIEQLNNKRITLLGLINLTAYKANMQELLQKSNQRERREEGVSSYNSVITLKNVTSLVINSVLLAKTMTIMKADRQQINEDVVAEFDRKINTWFKFIIGEALLIPALSIDGTERLVVLKNLRVILETLIGDEGHDFEGKRRGYVAAISVWRANVLSGIAANTILPNAKIPGMLSFYQSELFIQIAELYSITCNLNSLIKNSSVTEEKAASIAPLIAANFNMLYMLTVWCFKQKSEDDVRNIFRATQGLLQEYIAQSKHLIANFIGMHDADSKRNINEILACENTMNLVNIFPDDESDPEIQNFEIELSLPLRKAAEFVASYARYNFSAGYNDFITPPIGVLAKPYVVCARYLRTAVINMVTARNSIFDLIDAFKIISLEYEGKIVALKQEEKKLFVVKNDSFNENKLAIKEIGVLIRKVVGDISSEARGQHSTKSILLHLRKVKFLIRDLAICGSSVGSKEAISLVLCLERFSAEVKQIYHLEKCKGTGLESRNLTLRSSIRTILFKVKDDVKKLQDKHTGRVIVTAPAVLHAARRFAAIKARNVPLPELLAEVNINIDALVQLSDDPLEAIKLTEVCTNLDGIIATSADAEEVGSLMLSLASMRRAIALKEELEGDIASSKEKLSNEVQNFARSCEHYLQELDKIRDDGVAKQYFVKNLEERILGASDKLLYELYNTRRVDSAYIEEVEIGLLASSKEIADRMSLLNEIVVQDVYAGFKNYCLSKLHNISSMFEIFTCAWTVLEFNEIGEIVAKDRAAPHEIASNIYIIANIFINYNRIISTVFKQNIVGCSLLLFCFWPSLYNAAGYLFANAAMQLLPLVVALSAIIVYTVCYSSKLSALIPYLSVWQEKFNAASPQQKNEIICIFTFTLLSVISLFYIFSNLTGLFTAGCVFFIANTNVSLRTEVFSLVQRQYEEFLNGDLSKRMLLASAAMICLYLPYKTCELGLRAVSFVANKTLDLVVLMISSWLYVAIIAAICSALILNRHKLLSIVKHKFLSSLKKEAKKQVYIYGALISFPVYCQVYGFNIIVGVLYAAAMAFIAKVNLTKIQGVCKFVIIEIRLIKEELFNFIANKKLALTKQAMLNFIFEGVKKPYLIIGFVAWHVAIFGGLTSAIVFALVLVEVALLRTANIIPKQLTEEIGASWFTLTDNDNNVNQEKVKPVVVAVIAGNVDESDLEMPELEHGSENGDSPSGSPRPR